MNDKDNYNELTVQDIREFLNTLKAPEENLKALKEVSKSFEDIDTKFYSIIEPLIPTIEHFINICTPTIEHFINICSPTIEHIINICQTLKENNIINEEFIKSFNFNEEIIDNQYFSNALKEYMPTDEEFKAINENISQILDIKDFNTSNPKTLIEKIKSNIKKIFPNKNSKFKSYVYKLIEIIISLIISQSNISSINIENNKTYNITNNYYYIDSDNSHYNDNND